MDNAETQPQDRRRARWYNPDGVRAIMTAAPGDDTWRDFEKWCRYNDAAFPTVWGLPDFKAAFDVVGITRSEFAQIVSVHEDEIEAYEAGVSMPSMYTLLMFAYLVGWPLKRFFKNGDWHPRTRIARRIGLPRIPW